MIEFWRDEKLMCRQLLDYIDIKYLVVGKEEDALWLKASRAIIEAEKNV